MATLKKSFLVDLLVRLGFTDAHTYPPQLLGDIQKRLSVKYAREIQDGQLEEAASFISLCPEEDDTSSVSSDESLLQFVKHEKIDDNNANTDGSKLAEKNMQENTAKENLMEEDYENMLGDDDDGYEQESIIDRIRAMDLTNLTHRINLQKKHSDDIQADRKRPVPRPKKRRNDPVDMYHSHNSRWKRDSFLVRNPVARDTGSFVVSKGRNIRSF